MKQRTKYRNSNLIYGKCERVIPRQQIEGNLKRKCGVSQGSILCPLIFLIFANDLQHITKFLDPIMFADGTDLFYSNSNINELFGSNINELFGNINKELVHFIDWCFVNKLSIDTSKARYIYFHKQTDWNNIPLKLPYIKFNKIILKKSNRIKISRCKD